LWKGYEEATPGINWRWPYPAQTHEIVNMFKTASHDIEIGSIAAVQKQQPNEARC